MNVIIMTSMSLLLWLFSSQSLYFRVRFHKMTSNFNILDLCLSLNSFFFFCPNFMPFFLLMCNIQIFLEIFCNKLMKKSFFYPSSNCCLDFTLYNLNVIKNNVRNTEILCLLDPSAFCDNIV